MSTESTTPLRNIVRVFQTHDVAGVPAPHEFVQEIRQRGLNTVGAEVLVFLAPLSPALTDTPGVFSYTDPTRGSGWMRLENFGAHDAVRVQELVQMAEIERAIGRQPLRVRDVTVGRSLFMRSHNPYFFFVWGLVVVGIAIYALAVIPDPSLATFYRGFAIVFFALGTVLFIYGGIKVLWWHRARSYARSRFGTLPSDLRGI